MYQSDHDEIAERKRHEAHNMLIDLYTQIASEQSDEYGFLNVLGHEVPDPTVVEPPLGYVPAPDLMEQMRRMVRTALSEIADNHELETFEDADDFDIDEDPVDYSSPYEEYFDPAPGAPAGPAVPAQPSPGVTGAEPPPPAPSGAAEPAPPAKPTT